MALCFLMGGSPGFRSDADPEALAKAREDGIPNLILYNYPSFSGAFFALFAHLFHSRLCLRFPVLPFSSSVVPFRVEDLYIEGLQQCHLFDFAGSRGFAAELIAFDNRESTRVRVPSLEDKQENVIYNVDLERSSSNATYNYYADRLAEECKLSPIGKLSTGDSLDMSPQDYPSITANDATVKDMEGEVVAYVAEMLKVPVIFVKVVTDIVDGDKPSVVEFLQNLASVTAALDESVTRVVNFG